VFLTPGSLDYFNLKLEYLRTNSKNQIILEAKVSNILLRLFAPKLTMVYDAKTKKIISYDGLSNISDDKDKTQAVRIAYKY